MGSPAEQIHHGAHVIIRRGDEVLLVRQHPSFWPNAFWSLPGGSADAGELLHETLAREIVEETGLAVDGTGCLAWLINIVRIGREIGNPRCYTLRRRPHPYCLASGDERERKPVGRGVVHQSRANSS